MRRRTPDRPCLNCGDPTPGNYCPECGQAKRDFGISVRFIALDVLEEQLIINRTLPRTVGALLFRPGFLTNEYIAGRMVRYIAPFRLYLVASVIFFLVLSFFGLRALERVDTGGAAAEVAGEAAPLGMLQPWARNMVVNTGDRSRDSLFLARVVERYGHLPFDQALREFLPDYAEFLPHMVFFMLPLFAFMLKLLYARRRRYYAEHVIFSLHVHAFIFLIFILMFLIRFDLFTIAASLWILVYLWLAMKRVYRQGWFRTTVKWGTLGFAYFVLLNLGLVATLFVTILL